MINFKKGPALSLHQVNYVGKPAPSDAQIIAGQVVRVEDDGVHIGAVSSAAPNALYGFAINSYNSGDVIEAGVIGVYALDGHSVIETDQFTGVASDYTIGTQVTATTDGKITPVTSGSQKVLGQVEGSRELPGKWATTTLTGGRAFTYPANTTVVGVKLSS
jgi:hypothetical protein